MSENNSSYINNKVSIIQTIILSFCHLICFNSKAHDRNSYLLWFLNTIVISLGVQYYCCLPWLVECCCCLTRTWFEINDVYVKDIETVHMDWMRQTKGPIYFFTEDVKITGKSVQILINFVLHLTSGCKYQIGNV